VVGVVVAVAAVVVLVVVVVLLLLLAPTDLCRTGRMVGAHVSEDASSVPQDDTDEDPPLRSRENGCSSSYCGCCCCR
jgi:hypothetical protein